MGSWAGQDERGGALWRAGGMWGAKLAAASRKASVPPARGLGRSTLARKLSLLRVSRCRGAQDAFDIFGDVDALMDMYEAARHRRPGADAGAGAEMEGAEAEEEVRASTAATARRMQRAGRAAGVPGHGEPGMVGWGAGGGLAS